MPIVAKGWLFGKIKISFIHQIFLEKFTDYIILPPNKLLIMKKILLSLFFLLSIAAIDVVKAQTVSIATNGATSQLNTLGNAEYHVSEYIYSETEIGASNFITAGTAINRIQLDCIGVGAPTTFGNVKIYMQNVASGTTSFTTGTYSTAGYTTVYSGSFSVTAIGLITIDLTTPFVRTSGTNLQVMIERTDGIAKSTPFTYYSINTVASASRRYNGATALSGSTSLTTSSFRSAINLIHVFNNDLGVDRIETFGKIPVGAGLPHSIKASITNYGYNTIPAGTNVSLNVTGSNTFSNTQTTSALAPGASQTITFAAIPAMVAGTNTIIVSAASDDNASNNSATFTQLVTTTAVGYPNSDAINSGVGFGTGAGILANSYKLPVATTVSAVKFYCKTSANTVFGVITNSVGEILGQTADYTVQAADSNNYVTLTFTTPINVPADSVRFIGIGQRTGTYGYYPVGAQAENPARPNTYASMGLTGGAATYYTTLGRFVLEAVLSSSAPVSLTNFTGNKSGDVNNLQWTTANETNNAGFELQRSINGADFTTITKIASKADNGNSTNSLNYSYSDKTPLKGTNYYRLYQLDKDGKGSYSKVVAIKNSTKGVEISNVYPNPAKDNISLTINSLAKNQYTISIYDLVGKEIARKSIDVNGSMNVQFNTSNFAKGTYVIKVTSSENTVLDTQRFIKQ